MKTKIILQLIVVNFSSILYSQNDWQLLNPLPTQNQGKQIEFINDNHGFILTSEELLETFDFGESWTINSIFWSAKDVDFSSDLGVVIGVGSDNRITFNGGIEWQSLNVPVDGVNTVKVFENQSIFLTSSTKLYISNNFGENWITYNLPYNQVIKSHFINELVGYICSQNGEISKTIDGGQTWELQYDYNNIPGNFKTIYFANENLGFAFRDHSTLLRTDNGGQTWTETNFDYDMHDFHFINDQVGFMAGEMGKIYKTTNAGITWNPKNYDNTIYGTPWYLGVYFKSENEGLLCGQRGMIIKTTNSGGNWQPYSFLYDPIWGGKLFDEVGYVHTLQKLYKTIDGGENWSTSNKPSNSGMIRNVQFFDENNGIILAGSPTSDDVTKLYKTADGGQTWSIVNDEYSQRLGVHFINESLGFAYDDHPSYHMQITTNGGQSFELLGYNIYSDFYFFNENIGFAKTNNSKIVKTVDGGFTWEEIYQDNYTIYDIDFLNENIGYMVTSSCCRVYKTIDGGLTWTQTISSPVSDYINKLKFYTPEKGYVIDDDNIVYHTVNGGDNWNISINYYNFTRNIEIVGNNALLYGDNGLIAKTNTNHMSVNDFPINPKYEIQVYPNPSSYIVNIKIDQSLNINRLEIYDFTGKLISQKLTNKTDFSINDLNDGVYILKVYTKEQETFSTKLIVKK